MTITNIRSLDSRSLAPIHLTDLDLNKKQVKRQMQICWDVLWASSAMEDRFMGFVWRADV